MNVKHLHCEYLKDPLCIDIRKPRLSWILQADPSARGVKQSAYQILLSSSEDLLKKDEGDLWNSGKVESDHSVQVEYAGKPLDSRQRCYWKVKAWDQNDVPTDWSEIATWSMGLLTPECWTAKWIGLNPKDGLAEFPWLRKTFVLGQFPVDGRIYVNSLGYYELYINGEKIGDDVLSPAVTQLSHRSFYLVHDVTKHLRKGANSVAIWLGRGWYLAGRQGYAEIQRADGPVVRAQLEISDEVRKTICVVTDESWKAFASPIKRTDDKDAYSWSLTYDARLEQDGWNTLGFDDRHWPGAQVCEIVLPHVCAQMVEMNRIQRVSSPVSIEPLGENTWWVDMGINLAGWLKVRLSDIKEPGKKIIFDYFDHLDPNGKPADPFGHDEYIASGKGNEEFRHRFNYQGFRYIRISGLAVAPGKEDISASLIHTDFTAGSSFASSNRRLTSIHDMVAYTLRCLTLGGYMVDCPHLERLGYGGDGQSSVESALMMYGLGPFYRSWLAAWRDSQGPDGDMPHTAPTMYAGGGPYWCGFIIAASWAVYQQYMDRLILEENYPAMQKWLEFVEMHSRNGDIFDVWPNTLRRNWFLGDWATPSGIDQKHLPSVKLVNNCFRIYYYDLMTLIAAVLGKKDDATRYQEKADSLRPVVHRAFYNAETKTYADGDQIDLALPLLTGVVPTENHTVILRQLEQDILQKHGGHLAVGLVGLPVLVKLLMQANRNDLIFTFTDKDTYPGWGYMLKNGATTTWEHWNGKRSHIHNTYNAIGVWFYQGLAGIQPDPKAPGFKHFIIRPALVGDLTWVKAAYNSIHGMIISEWKIDEERLEIKVSVPVNCTATVYVPMSGKGELTESGKPVQKAAGLKYLRLEKKHAVCQVESGTYVFSEINPGKRQDQV